MKDLPIGYVRSLIRMVLTGFVIAGSLNYGLTVFDYNLIEISNNKIDNFFNKKLYFNVILYFLIAISGIILMFQTTTWLPFLGPCAFPSKGLIPNKVNSLGTKIVKVKVKPNTRVAYWASLPIQNNPVPYVEDAYDNFSNSGVVTSNSDGIAELSIIPGSPYTVPFGKKIEKHIHYRELDNRLGMMGELKTVYY
jgi:uncharacterized membrane protein YuzA (DUF378 family)